MDVTLKQSASASAKLRAARALLDLSQKRFAETLGISDKWLALLESGVETPNLSLALVLEERFGIRPAEWKNSTERSVA